MRNFLRFFVIVCPLILAVVAAPAPSSGDDLGRVLDALRLIQSLPGAQPSTTRAAPQQRRQQPAPQPPAQRNVDRPAVTSWQQEQERARIREAQANLNRLGFDAGPEDGRSGPRTRAAVAAFRASYGLPGGSAINDQLLGALRMAAGAQERALPGPVSSDGAGQAFATSASFAPLSGFDLPGGDYRSGHTDPGLRGITEAGCRTACSSDPRCRGYTFNTGAAICFLKASIGSPVPFAGAVSGIRSDGPPPVSAGHVSPEPSTTWVQSPGSMSPAPEMGEAQGIHLAMEGGGTMPGGVLPGAQDSALPVNFDTAPPPDYATLLRLYMAENADLLNNDAFALRHHADIVIASMSEEAINETCKEYIRIGHNEIAVSRIVAQAREGLAENLAVAGAWPRTGMMKVRVRRPLKDYDMTRSGFPVSDRLQRITVEPVKPCPGLEVVRVAGLVPDTFIFEIANEAEVAFLPMPQDHAEAYLYTGHGAEFDYLLEVGPIVHDPESGTRVPARIVAARALRPDGEVLHVYDGLRPAAGEPLAEKAVVDEVARLTPFDRGLFWLSALRYFPDALDGERLQELTRQQIVAERYAWEQQDQRHPDSPRDLFYVWQEFETTNPDKARSLVEHLFAPPVPDWSFAETWGDFDPRLGGSRDAAIFLREGHDGPGATRRDATFAARELAPVTKRLLLAASRFAVTDVFIDRSFRSGDYDFERQSLEFLQSGISLPAVVGKVQFAADPLSSSESGTVLPAELQERANYRFSGSDVRGSQTGSLQAFRRNLARASPEGMLSLDRHVELEALPISPEIAESLTQRSGRMAIRLGLKIEGAVQGRMNSQQVEPRPVMILLASVRSLNVVDENGSILVELSPDILPDAAARVAAAEEAAAGEARAAAEAAERDQRTAADRAARLAALLEGRSGTIMVRRRDATAIDAVYTTNSNYSYHAESRPDLPARATGAIERNMAGALRENPNAALVIDAERFGSVVFAEVEDLDLVVSDFPPEPPASSQPMTTPRFPDKAQYVVLTRRDHPGTELRWVRTNFSVMFPATLEWARQTAEKWEIPFEVKAPGLEQVDLRDIPGRFREHPGTAAILTLSDARSILPHMPDLDLVVRRHPIEDFHISSPQHHQEGPEEFAILGVSIGMTRDQALAAVEVEFAPDAIDGSDPGRLTASRGKCDPARLLSPASSSEIGSHCLAISLLDGVVESIRSRQVAPGNVVDEMAEAIRRKYGWTPFLTETRHFEGNDKRILYGWGQLLGKDRSGLNRLGTPLPPAVMEAAVWGQEEATTIILGLDRPAPAEEPAFELKL